jgi:hypothetical protein
MKGNLVFLKELTDMPNLNYLTSHSIASHFSGMSFLANTTKFVFWNDNNRRRPSLPLEDFITPFMQSKENE